MEKIEEGESIAHLNDLIKQKKNDEIKAILLKDAMSNLIDKQESTLFHTAVAYNNIHVIAFLFTFGFNINAQNSLGQTPLLLAATNHSYQTVQLLLTLDADILIADANGQTPLQVLVDVDKEVPAHLIGTLFDRLQRYKLSSNGMANELAKARCSLEQVIKFNDPEVTREFLIVTNERDPFKVHDLLHRTIAVLDMENSTVLLQYASTTVAANDPAEIVNLVDPNRPFFEQFVDWETIAKQFIYEVFDIFRKANEDVVKVYLDSGFDKYCRDKFGWELLVYLFYNENIDVIKLLENRQFDINGREWAIGNTALHVATMCANEKYVAYLLEHGANPNIRNRDGKTPLFHADSLIIELLINAGADLQVINERNQCATAVFSDLALAHLMIAKDRGVLNEEIRTFIYDHVNIDLRKWLRIRCDEYTENLAWMKTRLISKSVNLFMLLVDDAEKMFCHVKSEEDLAAISEAIQEHNLKPAYVDMLMKKFKKICEINELRLKAARFLCKKIELDDYKHLVIDKIVELLTYQDVLVFNDL